MKNYVPFEKLSKKEQKKINNEKRNDWNGLNPVTRTTKDKTKYNRKNKHRLSYDYRVYFFYIYICVKYYVTLQTSLKNIIH